MLIIYLTIFLLKKNYRKRPSNIPSNVFWKILSFFTWPRLKILFILTLLVFAIYMFGSEAPEPENVLDLRATSASNPLVNQFFKVFLKYDFIYFFFPFKIRFMS